MGCTLQRDERNDCKCNKLRMQIQIYVMQLSNAQLRRPRSARFAWGSRNRELMGQIVAITMHDESTRSSEAYASFVLTDDAGPSLMAPWISLNASHSYHTRCPCHFLSTDNIGSPTLLRCILIVDEALGLLNIVGYAVAVVLVAAVCVTCVPLNMTTAVSIENLEPSLQQGSSPLQKKTAPGAWVYVFRSDCTV
jgi:hypothetical protein